METTTHRKISAFLTVMGLAMLLILSPCKVRNFIEAELGVPQTEVANKSKASISDTSCHADQTIEATVTAPKPIAKTVFIVAINSSSLGENIFDFITKSTTPFLEVNHSVSFVPLYILYRNFKVYLK